MLVHIPMRIHKVRVPLPYRLNHINCYAVQGTSGWCLIDTGLDTDSSRQVWQQFMTDQGIKHKDIQAIYLTHFHADHFGSAGWLQSFTHAPIFISTIDEEGVHKYYQEFNPRAIPNLKEMCHAWGVPSPLIEEISDMMTSFPIRTLPFPKIKTIEPGSTVQLGDFNFNAVLTPGHTAGHICFFNQDNGVLLSGDHLLQKITSNICLMSDGDPDPIDSYLKTLRDNLQLSIELVLPAHGCQFTNVKERIRELQLHHQERLTLINGLVTEGSTVYGIYKKVFGERLNVNEISFALAEIAAHLMHMVKKGELEVELREGIEFFSKSK